MLTTPGLFPPGADGGGWCPPDLAPVAAVVPRGEPVSGWDLARGGPKPTRFAVPAGAVYVVETPPSPRAIPGSLCAAGEAGLGWGCHLEGVC